MDLLVALAAGLAGVSLCIVGVRIWRSRTSAIGGGIAGVVALALGALMILAALAFAWGGTSEVVRDGADALMQPTPVPVFGGTPP